MLDPITSSAKDITPEALKQQSSPAVLTALEKRIIDLEKRLFFSEKLFNFSASATAPSYTPKNFAEQFAVYDTGAVRGIHIYINGNWRTVVLT